MPQQLLDGAQVGSAFQKMGGEGVPQGVGKGAQPALGDASLGDLLAKIGELRAAGVPSDEEFAAAKARLLGETSVRGRLPMALDHLSHFRPRLNRRCALSPSLEIQKYLERVRVGSISSTGTTAIHTNDLSISVRHW